MFTRKFRLDVLASLARIEAQQVKEAKSMADLATALSDLTTAVTNTASELATLKADLDAAIAAGNPAQIQAAADAIEAQVTALNAAAAAAKP